MDKLISKIKKTYLITLKSGLHIGMGKDAIEIGGIDNAIIRKKDGSMEPYIPGSSIKGKMRCLLEISEGYSEPSGDNHIGKLFGNIDKEKGNASRIIVRDAYLTEDSKIKLKNSLHTDLPYAEIKAETAIDRIKGSAKDGSLRLTERIPAGAQFEVEFVLNVFAKDEKEAEGVSTKLVQTFEKGLALLQDDYLGGSGSRGYGQVEFVFLPEKSSTKYTKDYLIG